MIVRKKDLLKEALTTSTQGVDDGITAADGAYETTVFNNFVRKKHLYYYIDEYMDELAEMNGLDRPIMKKHNHIYKGKADLQENHAKADNWIVKELVDFAINSEFAYNDLESFKEDYKKQDQSDELLYKDLYNYVSHLKYLYEYYVQNRVDVSDEERASVANELMDHIKSDVSVDEATAGAVGGGGSFDSAMGDSPNDSDTSGYYITPQAWAKNKKNWRNYNKKNTTYPGGKIVGNYKIDQTLNEGNKIPKAWKGGKYVKVKPKCKTFPYCSQGDSDDNPITLVNENNKEIHICEGCNRYLNKLCEQYKTDKRTMLKLLRK